MDKAGQKSSEHCEERTPAVTKELEHLQDVIQALEERMYIITSKLEPILRGSPEEVKDDKGVPNSGDSCPLSNHLYSLKRRLSILISQTHGLEDQMEI